MTQIPFNVSANTARLIGRENVSNLEGALIEIIKNSYDADASKCILYFEKSNNTLWIIDNGIGMTRDIVMNNWMTIGRSSKTNIYVSKSGRIQTGEKGIGRFALDRIASSCRMHTICNDNNFEWIIDWDTFSGKELITEIYAEFLDSTYLIPEISSSMLNLNLIKFLEKYFKGTGTSFMLEGLRDNWNSATIEKIKSSLSKLLPPDKKKNFALYLFEEDSVVGNAEIDSAFVETYDYMIDFEVDSKNVCKFSIDRNEFDFGIAFDKVMEDAKFTSEDRSFFKGTKKTFVQPLSDMLPGMTDINFGPMSGELYFYKLSTQEKNEEKFYYKDFSSRGNHYKNVSGIKIYRDNFIVRPYGFYGSTGYDWLDLSTRKAKSPAGVANRTGSWRTQATQMSGQIYISRINKNLPDKSSREGIVENQEFSLFKELVLKLISYMEEDRQYVIRKLDEYYKITAAGEAALEIARNVISDFQKANETKNNNRTTNKDFLIEQPVVASAQLETFKKAFEYQENRIEGLEEEMGLLRTLATTGIVVNTYIHEIKALTTKMNMGIKQAFDLLNDDGDMNSAIIELRDLRQLRKNFNSWFKVTLDSVKRDKRKMKKSNVNQIIINCVNSWKIVQNSQIEYKIVELEDVEIRCFPFDFESIFNNLITNTATIVKSSQVQKPQVIIKIGSNGGYSYIEYEDNGPGLCSAFKSRPEEILKQGITDRRDANKEIVGTGMGLWIVNNIIGDYRGYIDLSKNRTFKNGFYITLFFRNRRER